MTQSAAALAKGPLGSPLAPSDYRPRSGPSAKLASEYESAIGAGDPLLMSAVRQTVLPCHGTLFISSLWRVLCDETQT
jgi:hypothetical protein